jgi:hypothetical protein
MAKLIAILNVVAWSGFWAFGYLALSADRDIVVMIVLAAVGGAAGMWCWLWLVRHTEARGLTVPDRLPAHDLREDA